MGAGGDDQIVVREFGAVGEDNNPAFWLDALDGGLDVVDAVRDEIALGSDHLVRRIGAERYEQVARLVVVVGITVDDGDPPLAAVELRSKLVDQGGSGGAGSENEQILHGSSSCE